MLQRAGDGRAVPGIRVHDDDRVLTDQLGQRRAAEVLAAGIDTDGAVHGIRLLPHRADEPWQQPRAVVHNDHEGHDVAQRRGVRWQGSCLVPWATALRAGYPPGQSVRTT